MSTDNGNSESPSCLLRLRDALESHLLNLCDVEPEVLKRFCAFSTSPIAINSNQEYENGIQRVVRLTLTNKELQKHGLEPLLFDTNPTVVTENSDNDNNISEFIANSNQKNNDIENDEENIKQMLAEISKKAEDLTEDDINISSEIGLTPQEYVTIKGEYGMVMGLQLEKVSYERILKTCKSKSALKLRVDKNACRDFLCKKIIALARLRLRNPNTIPFFKKNNNNGNDKSKSLLGNIIKR